jgi:pyruvate dehydrogenase complex dehydrogenase (E1) component
MILRRTSFGYPRSALSISLDPFFIVSAWGRRLHLSQSGRVSQSKIGNGKRASVRRSTLTICRRVGQVSEKTAFEVTSYTQLRREALGVERWNRLHPAEELRVPHILKALEGSNGPTVAATDYIKAVPDQLAPWLHWRLNSLGTDGFGRSENREYLRRFFEISAEVIAQTPLAALARSGAMDARRAELAIAELRFHPEQRDPAKA